MARSVHIGEHHIDVVRDAEGMALHIHARGVHRARYVRRLVGRAFVQRFDLPGEPTTLYSVSLSNDRSRLLERILTDLRALEPTLGAWADELVRTDLAAED